jgi:hypothetical protein
LPGLRIVTKLRRPPEYRFRPRVNTLKIKRAYLWAADAELRSSISVLDESLPWLKADVLRDPSSLARISSDEASVFLFDDTSLPLVETQGLRDRNPNAVFVLLSFQTFIQCAPPEPARRKYPYTAKADLVFAVNRGELAPRRTLPSIVRAAEDLLNTEKKTRARRFVFLVVDDEPRWCSQFLPLLYGIIGQRADVRITRTYEDSLRFLFGVESESDIREEDYPSRGHGDDVVCLITDIFIPKGDDLQSGSGRDLVRLVNRYYPRIPVIIASKTKEAQEMKHLGFALPKGDQDSLGRLRAYILNLTGLGDFLVVDERGREMDRANDLPGICRILEKAEEETGPGRRLRGILENYGDKDKFSTWLYMHSYQELGDRLRPRRSRGRRLINLLKRTLRAEIARRERTPLRLGSTKIFDLSDLRRALRALEPAVIQPYSDNDILSSWLDRRGYPELAEEMRPIHGSGTNLTRALTEAVEKWIRIYRRRGEAT